MRERERENLHEKEQTYTWTATTIDINEPFLKLYNHIIRCHFIIKNIDKYIYTHAWVCVRLRPIVHYNNHILNQVVTTRYKWRTITYFLSPPNSTINNFMRYVFIYNYHNNKKTIYAHNAYPLSSCRLSIRKLFTTTCINEIATLSPIKYNIFLETIN